ncbi:MAG TPA: PDDEXK nuclease domain-containing protein [Cyclobacteriaceae bacterium]|nr:PDDEXK nuclease domain-containing protein [Cyclobacteriaceae bacterium]
MSSELDKSYGQILQMLKEKIRQARLRASVVVNTQLLQVYWEIGQTILEQQKKLGWGAKIIDRLAADLKIEFEDMKGLSIRNLKYMRAFADAYPHFVQFQNAQLQSVENQGDEIVQPKVAQLEKLVAQLPWTHNIVLLDKLPKVEERLFYAQKCIQNGWSKTLLVHQIESDLYNRQGKAITNFEQTLPKYQSDLARETFKNPYLFDFLGIEEDVHERELEKALIQHIKKFLLELGRGFAFVGNQRNLVVNGDDFFLDLLFYNYHLHCFIVFELKVGEFMPEYAGKLNFYINTIDQQIKGTDDKPTIGVLLCKTPNQTVVKFALTGIQSPIGVAEYELINTLPKQLKAQMPTVEELEAELQKELETPKRPLDAKLARIKELTKQMKGESLKERDKEITTILFTRTLPNLIERLNKRLASLIDDFKTNTISRIINEQYNSTTEVDLEAKLLNESVHRLGIHVHLQGHLKSGTKTFNIWKDLKFELYQYFYHIKVSTSQELLLAERLYDQPWTEEDLEQVTEAFAELIADDVVQNIERIQNQK